MSSTENTERRLLASIRQAKGTTDTPAPRSRRTSASRTSSKPAQAQLTGPESADPYQATPRVWPD